MYRKVNFKDKSASELVNKSNFNFERNYNVFKSKSRCILLNETINFNKNETENRKGKIPHTVLEKWTLCFSSYKNHKLKTKPWWVRGREEEKSLYFVPFILLKRNFSIFVLSQRIVYWIHFQDIHTFKYQKTVLHKLFDLFLKLSKAFIVRKGA